MIYNDIAEFLKNIGNRKRLLGIDTGEKRIGIALSDDRLKISSPATVIKSRKFSQDVEEIRKITVENNVGGIVVGLPLNMDGTNSARTQSTKQFGRNLAKLLDIPVTFFDERMSSIAAERILLEADLSRKRRGELIDKTAASYILQGFLDRLESD